MTGWKDGTKITFCNTGQPNKQSLGSRLCLKDSFLVVIHCILKSFTISSYNFNIKTYEKVLEETIKLIIKILFYLHYNYILIQKSNLYNK